MPQAVANVLQCSMHREISQRELRNDSGQVMRALDAGESLILTRNGIPVGEIAPIRKSRFVPSQMILRSASQLESIDPIRFRSDLDDFVDQEALPNA
jgi:antitoxin (DNA-binding transcriptional repressor) of toxin-antitoxin stability system